MFDVNKAIEEAKTCAEYSKGFCKFRPAEEWEKNLGLTGEVFEGITKFDENGKTWDKDMKWFVVPGNCLLSTKDGSFDAEFPEDFKGVYLADGIFIMPQDWSRWGINETNTLIVGNYERGMMKIDDPKNPYSRVFPQFGDITANRVIMYADSKHNDFNGYFDLSSKVNNLDVIYPSGVKSLGGDNVVLSFIMLWSEWGICDNKEVTALETTPDKLLPDEVRLLETGPARITAEEVVEAIGLTPEQVKENYGNLLGHNSYSNIIQWGRIMKEPQYAGIQWDMIPKEPEFEGIFPQKECIEMFREECVIREVLDGLKEFGETLGTVRGKLKVASEEGKASVSEATAKPVENTDIGKRVYIG